MFKRVIFGAVIATAGIAAGYYYLQDSKKSNTAKPVNPTPITTPVNTTQPITNTPEPVPTTPPINTPEIEFNSQVYTLLKQIGTMQNACANDNGSYASSLVKLDELGVDTKSIKDLMTAQKKGKEFKGFIFTDITDDKEGNDTRSKFGILASAIDPQKNKSYLILMDLNQQTAFSNTKKGSNANDEMQFYETTIANPIIKSWPTKADLKKWSICKPGASKEPN